MLSDELKSIRAVLGELLGKVDTDSADIVRQARSNLDAAAELAREIEQRMTPQEAY